MNAEFLCFAHVLIIAKAKENGDPKYKSYRNVYNMKQPVQVLLTASGVNLTNGGGFKELEQFQNYLSEYKIIVYAGLSPGRVLFSGNSLSNKKLYLLYDSGQYNVITNIKIAMSKRYKCNACDTYKTHKCDKACTLCTTIPPF